jgi:integrase
MARGDGKFTMPKKRIPQSISEEELKKIILAILKGNPKYKNLSKEKKFIRLRNIFMIFIQYYMGLRPKEARKIKLKHIDFQNKILFIPAENNKQRNQDNMPIPDIVFNVLLNYIYELKKIFKNSIWLFPNKYGNDCIDRGSHIRFFTLALLKSNLLQKSYCDKQNNLRNNLTLYSLRHSFGTNVYSKLKDIKKTASLLRHYDFQCRSTLIYIHTTQNQNRRDLFAEVYN